MKKILFYTDTGYFSGAEIYFSRLIAAAADEYRVEVLVSPTFLPVTHPDWQVIRDNPQVKISYQATGQKLNIFYFFRLIGYLRRYRPAVVVCNMWSPFANTLLLLAACLTRTPVMAIEHFYQEKADITGLLRPIKLFAYALTKWIVPLVVTVSAAHRRIFAEEFGFPPEQLAVLHSGVDVALATRPHRPGKIVELVFLGTLEERKDPLFIVEVLAELKDLPWRLRIVGRGPLEKPLGDHVAELGLKDKVELVGWVNDAGAILSGSDILVHPARSENFSGVLIEAEAHGLAIVANQVGGNGEIVTDQVSGFLLPAGDRERWTSALHRLITEPKLRQAMGEAGARQYREGLTLDMMKTNFRQLVEKFTDS